MTRKVPGTREETQRCDSSAPLPRVANGMHFVGFKVANGDGREENVFSPAPLPRVANGMHFVGFKVANGGETDLS